MQTLSIKDNPNGPQALFSKQLLKQADPQYLIAGDGIIDVLVDCAYFDIDCIPVLDEPTTPHGSWLRAGRYKVLNITDDFVVAVLEEN